VSGIRCPVSVVISDHRPAGPDPASLCSASHPHHQRPPLGGRPPAPMGSRLSGTALPPRLAPGCHAVPEDSSCCLFSWEGAPSAGWYPSRGC
jgi:hypothetical protein